MRCTEETPHPGVQVWLAFVSGAGHRDVMPVSYTPGRLFGDCWRHEHTEKWLSPQMSTFVAWQYPQSGPKPAFPDELYEEKSDE